MQIPRSDPYEDQVERYDRWFEKNRAAYLSELAAVKSSLPRFDRGLEAGVGTGRFAAPLGVTFGLDPSVAMMEAARRLGVGCVRGVAERLPFRDGAFDLVLMVTVDFLLSDKMAAFREMARVLAPGGAVVVGFIDRESPVGRRYQREKGERREGEEREKRGEEGEIEENEEDGSRGGKDEKEGRKDKGGGGFYGKAIFLAPEEMADLLKAAGFADLAFVQTLSCEPEMMTEVEPPRPGWGRGSFVVVRGKKGD